MCVISLIGTSIIIRYGTSISLQTGKILFVGIQHGKVSWRAVIVGTSRIGVSRRRR